MEKLISELRETAASVESIVQAQLLKEDALRLEQLVGLGRTAGNFEQFEKEALYLGWTQGDFRTPELHETLKPFLAAAYTDVSGESGQARALVRSLWIAFSQDRASKLVGCL
ncbi:MAG: hypothetical protein AAF441_26090 [Pseudomonadota bacterium]